MCCWKQNVEGCKLRRLGMSLAFMPLSDQCMLLLGRPWLHVSGMTWPQHGVLGLHRGRAHLRWRIDARGTHGVAFAVNGLCRVPPFPHHATCAHTHTNAHSQEMMYAALRTPETGHVICCGAMWSVMTEWSSHTRIATAMATYPGQLDCLHPYAYLSGAAPCCTHV